MRRLQTGLLLLAALAGCVRFSRPGGGEPGPAAATLEVTPAGRPPQLVRLGVPRSWIPLAPSASRAEFMAPDRRSRIYLRAMAAVPASKPCTTLARDQAREVIESWGGPPRTQVIRKEALEGQAQVDFELRRTDPKPAGELILGRVRCQEGVLAVATCAGPIPQEEALRPFCLKVMDGLWMGPLTPAPG